jgi:hypothetical protein
VILGAAAILKFAIDEGIKVYEKTHSVETHIENTAQPPQPVNQVIDHQK